jgi:hypothetical protein
MCCLFSLLGNKKPRARATPNTAARSKNTVDAPNDSVPCAEDIDLANRAPDSNGDTIGVESVAKLTLDD